MSHPRMYDEGDPILARIRKICLTLPEATEVEAWGRPTFRVGKIFATYGASQDSPSALIFKPDPAEAQALSEDERFFVPPYYPKWFGIDLAVATLDWDEVAELVESSYRQVALKRMLKTLDARLDIDNADGTSNRLNDGR